MKVALRLANQYLANTALERQKTPRKEWSGRASGWCCYDAINLTYRAVMGYY